MSTIVSSFVKDRASAAQLPTASLISGAAKALVKVDLTTFAWAGFNVASVVDHGVGFFLSNFTAPFASAQYHVLVSGTQVHAATNTGRMIYGTHSDAFGGLPSTKTATYCRCHCSYINNVPAVGDYDARDVDGAFMGVLA